GGEQADEDITLGRFYRDRIVLAGVDDHRRRRVEQVLARSRVEPGQRAAGRRRWRRRQRRGRGWRQLALGGLGDLDGQQGVAWRGGVLLRVTRRERFGHGQPLDDFAEDGVVAGEGGQRGEGDEELAAVGIGPGVGHGKQARLLKPQDR